MDSDKNLDSLVDLMDTTPADESPPTVVPPATEQMDLDDVLSASIIKTAGPTSVSTSNVLISSSKPPIKIRKLVTPRPTQPPPTPVVVSQSSSSALATKTVKPQQIVLLQKPGGTMQQIRIGNGPQSTATTNGQPSVAVGTATAGNFQLIKTSDGSFIQINGGKLGSPSTGAALTTTQTSTATTTPSSAPTQYIIKAGVGQRMLIPNTQTVKVPVKLNAANPSSSAYAIANNSKIVVPGMPTGTPRTLTVAQAQKMGLLSAAKLKELVSQATAQKQAKAAAAAVLIDPSATSSTSSASAHSTSTVRQIPLHNNNKTINQGPSVSINNPSSTPAIPAVNKQRVMPPGNQKILIQTAEGVQKQVVLPPHLYKLAQEGKIKAVSIAGKGIQYVRVNTPNTNRVGSGSGAPAVNTAATANANMSGGVKNNWSLVKLPVRSAMNPTTEIRILDQATRTLLPIAGTSKQEIPPKKKSTTSAPTLNRYLPAGPSHFNRPFRMLETIDPDTMIRHSSITTDERATSHSANPFAFSPSLQHHKANVFEEKITAYLSEDNGSTYMEPTTSASGVLKSGGTSSETDQDGPRRKHCNCTKSQCLKLYCDCFANGEFCQNCNCKDCFNVLEFEEDRHKAIKMCLERNPRAFKPKIGKGKDTTDPLRRHTKGCNCKRSGCLKNYCECYEAKIVCSENCKCIDCHNMDGFVNKPYSLMDKSFGESSSSNGGTTVGGPPLNQNPNNLSLSLNNTISSCIPPSPFPQTSGIEFEKSVSYAPPPSSGSAGKTGLKRTDRSESPEIPSKVPCNFMTQDVIEATIQCLIAQAEECQRNNQDTKTSEKLILEEFGRCLVEIIDFSTTSTNE